MTILGRHSIAFSYTASRETLGAYEGSIIISPLIFYYETTQTNTSTKKITEDTFFFFFLPLTLARHQYIALVPSHSCC